VIISRNMERSRKCVVPHHCEAIRLEELDLFLAILMK
jgi:hypothetical protein